MSATSSPRPENASAFRLEDRLGLLDTIEEAARVITQQGKDRPGYTWDQDVENARLLMRAKAAAVGDQELKTAVGALASITVPYSSDSDSPTQELDAGFEAVIERLAQVRTETLADD